MSLTKEGRVGVIVALSLERIWQHVRTPVLHDLAPRDETLGRAANVVHIRYGTTKAELSVIVEDTGLCAPVAEARPERVGSHLDSQSSKKNGKRGGGEGATTSVRKHGPFTATKLAGLGEDRQSLGRERDAKPATGLHPIGGYGPNSPLKFHLVPACVENRGRRHRGENLELESEPHRTKCVGCTHAVEDPGNLGVRRYRSVGEI
ncbi:MAG: hypothetical protein OXC01_14220 [Immundisolibacterales bacterium]|nr:hypothetical protein [Immundisolibacterales bacterium]